MGFFSGFRQMVIDGKIVEMLKRGLTTAIWDDVYYEAVEKYCKEHGGHIGDGSCSSDFYVGNQMILVVFVKYEDLILVTLN